MLPKENRLHSDKEIKDLLKSGRTFFLPEMVIKYKTNQEDTTKIGFIVSTKVDKKAVVRNKVARHFREVARELLPNIKTSYSVLIIAKQKVLELDFATIKKQINFAFDKLGFYNKK